MEHVVRVNKVTNNAGFVSGTVSCDICGKSTWANDSLDLRKAEKRYRNEPCGGEVLQPFNKILNRVSEVDKMGRESQCKICDFQIVQGETYCSQCKE